MLRSCPTRPPTGACTGTVQLRESLGSEVMVHLQVEAKPALTEDVRELAQDMDAVAVQNLEEGVDRDDDRRPLRRTLARSRG